MWGRKNLIFKEMAIIKNFKDLWYLMPFLDVLTNKISVIFSIIMGNEKIKLKIRTGNYVEIPKKNFETIIDLLGAITFAASCRKIEPNKITISFDLKNKFVIDLNQLDIESTKMLELLFNGTRFGATFLDSSNIHGFSIKKKTLKIIENGKKIIETSDGLRFYLENMTPGIIIETFIRQIHEIDSYENWDNKVVLDIGAECGDTSIFYANKGATVYSFEPMKAHYDSMMKNLSLNPELAKKITPINAAIGKDGELVFYHSNRTDIAENASFVYNTHGDDATTSKVDGYSLNTVYKKFGIKHVDLLKMDCKGCEFFLQETNLEIVENLKIEFLAYDENHKLENLLKILEKKNFQYIIFRHEPIFYKSNSFSATIYAKKIPKIVK